MKLGDSLTAPECPGYVLHFPATMGPRHPGVYDQETPNPGKVVGVIRVRLKLEVLG